MARDDFPAPSEGFVLTHFIVADDVARSRDFYTGVLGGTAVMGGEPTIGKLDPPRRRLEGQPCQVRQVGARDRARRRGRPSAQRCQVGQEGRVGARGQPLDWPRFPGPPSAAVAAAVAEGPAAARAGPGARCLGDASGQAGPTSATGDKGDHAQATRPWQGRVVDPGRGDEAITDLGGSQLPDGHGCLVSSTVIGSLDGASPSATGDDWPRPRGEGGVDAVCGCEAVAACLAGATPSATVRFIPREQGNSKATQSAGRGNGRWT
jgi:hypothetical protein